MSTGMHDHILPLPLWISILRVAQLVLGIILLGLAAYGVSVLVYSGLSLTIFTSLATIIATVYFLVTVEFYTIFYNYWAILGLDIFLVFFWLISFALAASEARHYYQVTPYEDGCFDDDYGKLRRRQECFRDSSSATYRNVLRVIAVFGAFEFVLFGVTLFFVGMGLHRHRKEGGHSVPNKTASNIEMEGGVASDGQPEAV